MNCWLKKYIVKIDGQYATDGGLQPCKIEHEVSAFKIREARAHALSVAVDRLRLVRATVTSVVALGRKKK